MTTIPFNIVDVFARERYTGNQLAVFRNVQTLSGDEMQRIAQEMGFSETTFILSDTERDSGYDVRIFTPGAEVPFAGHPTLGTAFIIRQEIIGKPVERVTLNLKVGQIPVRFDRSAEDDEILWMTPQQASFEETLDAGQVTSMLSVRPDDVDSGFPVQAVSTGLPFVLVPLRSLDAVRRARLVRDRWLEWVKDRPAKMVLLFCRQAQEPQNHLHVRVFADYYGIPEDPATGSANCCLAAYLVRHRYFGTDEIDVRVEQGYEIGRPSRLYLRAHDDGKMIHVQVGGRVFAIAKGSLL